MGDNRPQLPGEQLRRTLLQVHEEALEETSQDKGLQGKLSARLAHTAMQLLSPPFLRWACPRVEGVETGRSWEIAQREKSLSHQ